MKYAFIINGKSKNAVLLTSELKQKFGSEHVYKTTAAAGDARHFAQQATDDGCPVIIAVGGDGTIHEVINGMLASKRYSRDAIRLAILPNGTGNDFARNIHSSKKTDHLFQRLQQGRTRTIDIGHAQYADVQGIPAEHYFINVMDVGLGGCVAKRVNQFKKSRWSFLAYQRAIISSLPFYRKQLVNVSSDNLSYHGPALSIVIANGRWFGNGLCIAPEAELDDGQLEVTLLGNVGFFEYLWYLPLVLRGKKIQHKEVRYNKTNHLSIDTPNSPLELDGEFLGYTPCNITIVPRAIELIH
jgi:YegS/Rv2252/BmrU family lipid kinase